MLVLLIYFKQIHAGSLSILALSAFAPPPTSKRLFHSPSHFPQTVEKPGEVTRLSLEKSITKTHRVLGERFLNLFRVPAPTQNQTPLSTLRVNCIYNMTQFDAQYNPI